MKITDHILQHNVPDEFAEMNWKAFSVKMRLFNSNEKYKKLILGALDYLVDHLNTTWEDTAQQKAISGSKVGIPWNLLAWRDSTNAVRTAINPKIITRSAGTTLITSKCHSISLTEQFQITRYLIIDLEFFDTNGHKVIFRGIDRNNGSFGIQHELSHNDGIYPSPSKSEI